jgi:hypothetical protein
MLTSFRSIVIRHPRVARSRLVGVLSEMRVPSDPASMRREPYVTLSSGHVLRKAQKEIDRSLVLTSGNRVELHVREAIHDPDGAQMSALHDSAEQRIRSLRLRAGRPTRAGTR